MAEQNMPTSTILPDTNRASATIAEPTSTPVSPVEPVSTSAETSTSSSPIHVSRFNSNERALWREWMYSQITRMHGFITALTYPFMLILTLVCLLMVVTFCIFPTLLCMGLGVCLYYCMMEDPIPLSVLLRYMLSPDPNDTPYHHNYPETLSREAIESKIIIRKVLKIEAISENDDNSTRKETPEYPRQHPSAITVVTDHMRLFFSKPIVYEENDETSSGKESNNHTPNYLQPGTDSNAQTPTENGLSLALEPIDEETGHGGRFVPVPPTREEIELVDIAIAQADDDRATSEENLTLPQNETSHPNEFNQAAQEATCEEDHLSFEELTGEGKGSTDSKTGDLKTPAVVIGEIDGGTLSKGAVDYFGIDDTRDCGTTCDICLLDYEVGDEVAWSPNLKCIHAFHKECILDWLVRKPTCPSCRTDYLKCSHDDNV